MFRDTVINYYISGLLRKSLTLVRNVINYDVYCDRNNIQHYNLVMIFPVKSVYYFVVHYFYLISQQVVNLTVGGHTDAR